MLLELRRFPAPHDQSSNSFSARNAEKRRSISADVSLLFSEGRYGLACCKNAGARCVDQSESKTTVIPMNRVCDSPFCFEPAKHLERLSFIWLMYSPIILMLPRVVWHIIHAILGSHLGSWDQETLTSMKFSLYWNLNMHLNRLLQFLFVLLWASRVSSSTVSSTNETTCTQLCSKLAKYSCSIY